MQDIFHTIIQLNFNWVDAIIFAIIMLYAIEGYGLGIVFACFDVFKFVISFIAGLKGYGFIALILSQAVHMPKGYANAIGFFLAAVITDIICHLLLKKIARKINNALQKNQYISLNLSNFFGIFPAMLSGTILLMFLLTVIIALPVSPFLKDAISTSRIGSFLVGRSEIVEGELATIFGGAANETINFLTVEPQGNATVTLNFTMSDGKVDTATQQQMIQLVNMERSQRGEETLVVDIKLTQLAQDYAQYMLSHGYFSHYTPDGLSPFDRMSQRDISFQYAGENLAFSANVNLAMQGLMNSPGHKANILSTNFHRVGIGVIDAGIYGEMFVQEFTD
jgi:uncharacterized protein YkwD